MPSAPPGPRIFISVAEQSADEHAAALIRAFRGRQPEASFAGLTGPATRAAGCQTFHDLTAQSAMALAAIRRVPEALFLLHRLKAYLTRTRFDAAVMVDSPTLNLPLARICHRRGIPVLYYIAPQTWAWAAWRNARIRRRVKRLACIWPFEEEYFHSRGIHASYVGHPAFERLLALEVDEARVAELRAGGLPLITLLPGSRTHVVREVLPGQLEVAAAVRKHFRHARFLIVPANEVVRPLIESLRDKSAAGPAVDVLPPPPQRNAVNDAVSGRAAQRATAIRSADLVLAASGTATLEVAYHGTPMIVMYNANRWMYRLLGRWLISTEHLSIPNILAGRRLIPEFMPYYRSIDPIVATAIEWLATPATLARIRRELNEVIKPIVKPGASENAAAQLAAILADSH
ncbi:MAG: hypothetical protein V3S01_09425, partial [Dehalococcoidia bacterium]